MAYSKEKNTEYKRRYREKNRSVYNQYMRELRKRKRKIAIEQYGGKCSCCGEHRYEFLAFDHVNGDGAKDRSNKGVRKWQGTPEAIVDRLFREGFPDNFRVLCHNCNSAMGFHGYCPHEKERLVESQLKTTCLPSAILACI